MRKFLITTALCAVALPTAVMAAPVTGTSNGSFSSLSNCDNSGSSRDCDIFDTVANGSNTQVKWGSTNSSNFTNASTLTAVDLAISAVSTATNVKIGQLTWFNSATDGDRTPNNFDVNYTLAIAFSSPIGSTGDSELFNLNIVSPTNPPGDLISAFTTTDLSNLTFILPGWTVSGLHYVADGGTTFGGSCGTNTWCNPESNTGNLYIEANFTQNVAKVPEPLTLSLFGAGLAGAAALRRRKQNRA